MAASGVLTVMSTLLVRRFAGPPGEARTATGTDHLVTSAYVPKLPMWITAHATHPTS